MDHTYNARKLDEAMEHLVQGICLLRQTGLDWQDIADRVGQYIDVIHGDEKTASGRQKTIMDKMKDMEIGYDDVDIG